MSSNVKDKIIRGVIISVGVVVFVVGMLLMTRDVTRVANWSRSGFVLCSVDGDDKGIRFFNVDRDDFIAPPYPVRGDTILTIADSSASLKQWIESLEVAHAPGRIVNIAYRHEGQELTTQIKTRPVAPSLRISVCALQVLKVFIFLSFLGLGFWTFIKRPNSAAVRVLALYSFSMATFMTRTFMPMYAQMAAFRIPNEGFFLATMGITGFFFSGFWLLLQMYFPRPAALIERRPWLVYSFTIFPLLFIFLLNVALGIIHYPRIENLRFVVYMAAVVQIVAGLIILACNYRRAETYLEKRQTKLVLWGSGVSLILFLAYLLERYAIFPDIYRMPLLWHMLGTDLIFMFLLLSPLSLVYAVGKYRLLEVEGRLRRGTRHLFTLIFSGLLVFGIGYYANRLISQVFELGGFWNIALTIVVVAIIIRGAQSLEKKLESRFYPERQRLRRMIHDFLQRTASFDDRQAFWSELEEQLRDSLAVEGVYPVLRAGDNGHFMLRDTLTTPFCETSMLIRKMERDARPIMVDEAMSSDRIPMSEPEIDWLIRNRVALVLPLVAHGQLVGFLGFGMKVEQEDYAAEELRILSSLAPQFAIASDNLRLIVENVDKRRMEDELRVARRVQQRFLPKELPNTPGLKLATHSIFCHEVAGDYYDVIVHTDGRTALAIGDVSGKGAGAALIMANLQASLRALCGLGLKLDALMLRINELIHDNTDPDQFITLWVGVFDPKERVLRYVNAGHNFPILIRSDGREAILDRGGLILGPFPDATFEQGCVRLDIGDTILLFTDGVSEAINSDGDELGEDLVRDVVRAHADETPEQIINQIITLVDLHQGDRSPADDQTLVAVRIV